NKVSEAEALVSAQVANLSGTLGEVSTTLEQRAAAIREAISGNTRELADAMNEAEKALEARGNSIRDSISGKTQELATTMNAVEKALEARGNSIRSVLDDRTRELNSMLSTRSAELSRLIDEKAAPVVASYAETGRAAAEQIAAAAEQSAERLRSENAALVDAISQRTDRAVSTLSAAEQNLVASASQLIERLGDSNAGLSSMIDQAVQSIGSLDSRLGATANRFNETATQATDMLSTSNRLLDDKLGRLTAVSGETLQQVSSIVSRFGDHTQVLGKASELLSAAQSNLVGTLEERQQALRDLSIGLVKRSEEIETTMQSLGKMVETAFDRAEQRSGQMAGNLRQSVQASFTDIGQILGETEKRAQSTAASMRDSVQASFSDVGEMLGETEKKAQITAANMRNALLSAEQEAQQSIDKTLSEAEKRSGELANRLRGGLAVSLNDIDHLLGEAGRKSEGAAAALRQAMQEAVNEAVARFTGATDEIRRSAVDIRKELDLTRNELKRGAFDLPEEAKESAAQMRRAVAEQIKALQDISQLVGRTSQTLEISEPVARRLAEAQPEPVRRPAAPPQPARQTESLGLRGSLGATEPYTQSTAATTRAEGGGWISDLLRGASREEPAEAPAPARPAPAPQRPVAESQPARQGDTRNPRHMVESLNSLSVDIARAIDHDASVDLWRRYQRGERDIFTRRLYTLKGQQTFDEIKRKYDREPEFRVAVDRYIADFEKLLADVARTDRDKSITQSYLTSDTGKVYTMLAHAAGRFS
ncbi:MAG: hypothetical protein VX601_05305, partial [Pseudomonadota bacterium]|nr:hypothetical protein [Pseudomonadota bacterium]